MTMPAARTSRSILAELVAFDTTSRNSNLACIDYVETLLAENGVTSRRVYDADGGKTNLWATIGPDIDGGTVLSGHSDCVPVDGEVWTSDPFVLTERDGRLYGRGAADMKGFLACMLAAVPALAATPRERPVHLAISYDEEIGCVGVRGLIDDLGVRGARPALCIVGEPTSMEVVIGHKGGRAYRCTIDGLSVHSSLAPRGVSAIEYAAELIVFIRGIGKGMAEGPHDSDFDLTHSTVSVGLISGGTAINIVSGNCSFVFEYRTLDGVDQDKIFGRIRRFAETSLLPQMRAIAPSAAIRFEQIYEYPAHAISESHPLVTRVKHLVGRNGHRKVAFGAEAGLFQRDLGIATVLCGPGSIAVAHMPDEYVDIRQLEACEAFLLKLCEQG